MPGYNIQPLFRILAQHTVALKCAKSLELPQNGFLRGNQDCIRDELGQNQLESVLERRILEGDGAPWEVSIYRCLEPNDARSLLFIFVSAGARQSGIEVTDEVEGCWTKVISTFDAAEIVAADPDPTVVEEFGKQIRSCLVASADPRPLTFEGGLVDLLRLIRKAEAYRAFVSYNDYVRARAANGIEAPAEGANDADLDKYIRELFSAGVAPGHWISGFTDHATVQLKQREYLSFDIGDVEQSILAGEPPNMLEAATGRFDPEATDRALAACADCPDPEIHEHLEVKFYSWGEDYAANLEKRLQPPVYDQLGRGGRIAVLDSIVFRTLATEGMWSLIETYRDAWDSLADDPALTLAARELRNLGVYSAILVGDVERFTTDPLDSLLSAEEQAQLEKMRAQLGMEAEDTPDEFSVLGAGVARDSDGFFTMLVFVYEDADVANRNVQDLEEMLANGQSVATGQPWIEYFPQSEVWNDGRTLIARLRTEHPRIWLHVVFNNENLLWPK